VKRTELTVGAHYGWAKSQSWDRYPGLFMDRVEILDLGPFVKSWRGSDVTVAGIKLDGYGYRNAREGDKASPVVAVREVRPDGTLWAGVGNNIRLVSISQIRMPWADYLTWRDKAVEAAEQAHIREAEEQVREQATAAELSERAKRHGVHLPTYRISDGKVSISVADMTRLLDLADRAGVPVSRVE
jgi:hypothetical protein